MRTTSTYWLRTAPTDARELVATFLVDEGLAPEFEEDWDGSALWESRALRFAIAEDIQGYVYEVHIRDLGQGCLSRSSVELRQHVCGYSGEPVGPRRTLVAVEHLDDKLRVALERGDVLERVEQFV